MTQGSPAKPRELRGVRREDPLHALLDIAERMIMVGDLIRGHVLYRVDPEEPTIRVAAKLQQMGFDVAPLAESPITRVY